MRTRDVKVRHLARPHEARKENLELPLLSVSSIHGVVPRAFLTSDEPRAEDLSRYRVCAVNDIVINRMSAYQGALGRSQYDGIVSPDYLVLRLSPKVSARFIDYLFRSDQFIGEITSRLRGIGSVSLGTVRTPRINWVDLGDIDVALPNYAIQEATADYLDRETGQIDELIAKQERLVELLAERRQAAITQAVTKGLDPSVDLNDSGSVLYGMIPAPWRQMQLKHILLGIQQGISPEAEATLVAREEWGVLKAGCVNGGIFNQFEHKRLPNGFVFDPRLKVSLGDFLVNRASGSPRLVGSAAIVRDLSRRLILSDKIFRLKITQLANRDFLEHYCQSHVYREQVLGAISGADGLANNLPSSSLRTFAIALPPIEEQVEISEHLNQMKTHTDSLSARAKRAIALLKERRQALISAAVTGKIDVREM